MNACALLGRVLKGAAQDGALYESDVLQKISRLEMGSITITAGSPAALKQKRIINATIASTIGLIATSSR